MLHKKQDDKDELLFAFYTQEDANIILYIM